MRTLWSTHARSPRQSKFSRQAHLAPDATIARFRQLAPPHHTRLFSRRRRPLHARSTPPGPRRHDLSILTAGPTPSQTRHTPLFTPPTYIARLVHPTCPQTPRSQHSGSWPHPLTHTAHADFHAAHLLFKPRPPHLPPDATTAAFREQVPPPHTHRKCRS